MGAVGLNSPRLGAFQSDIFPRGLDLGRSVILQDVGVWKAAEAADFEAGMLVAHDAAGEVVKCTSKPVLGVAKWNKTNVYKAVNVDEPISFPASGDTVNLKKPNVSNLQIQDLPDLAGTPYTLTTDYTVSAANGTVTHAGGGSSIPVATTVYVTYTFELSSSDFDFQGRNFFNFLDDVTIADGRITVITDATILYTTQYDTAQVYTLTGVTKNLYCGGATPALAGLFTSDSGEGDFVGHVIQLPSADDPFLGVRLGGDPVIVT
jgi:hypothetical protein